MHEQHMAPQAQTPKSKNARPGSDIASILALLWRFIAWIWSILILGIMVGVLGNAGFTLLTTGKIDFTGTVTVLTWLSTHLLLWITPLILFLFLTLCSSLAHYQQGRTAQEKQRAQ